MNCAKKKCDFAPKQRGMSEKNMDISSTNIRIYEQRQTMSTRQGIKAAKFWEFKQHKGKCQGLPEHEVCTLTQAKSSHSFGFGVKFINWIRANKVC